jgi:hypothetical protein
MTQDALMSSLSLRRDGGSGHLAVTHADGTVVAGAVPIRAYPLTRPDQGVSLVNAQGHEVAWIAEPTQLDSASQTALREALAQREFRPVIEQLVSVSTFATPSTWHVRTNRGDHTFILKAEEDIRRLDGARLLITSKDGVNFQVNDRYALDRASRKLLERFL